jgi:hypothetical protein
LLIFKQEKLCSQIYVDPNIENKSRFKADFSDCLGGPQKKKLLAGRMWPAGRYLLTPGLEDESIWGWNCFHNSPTNSWNKQLKGYCRRQVNVCQLASLNQSECRHSVDQPSYWFVSPQISSFLVAQNVSCYIIHLSLWRHTDRSSDIAVTFCVFVGVTWELGPSVSIFMKLETFCFFETIVFSSRQ